MKPTKTVIVFDAADLEAESSFWAALLDGEVERDDDWHRITVDGEYRYAVQLAPDHVPPQWPDGAPQQVHLDLSIDDIDAAHAEVMDLGARVLTNPTADGTETFRVYADPAGHPFCLCWC